MIFIKGIYDKLFLVINATLLFGILKKYFKRVAITSSPTKGLSPNFLLVGFVSYLNHHTSLI